MGDGGECDGEEIKNDASLWRKPERKKRAGMQGLTTAKQSSV
jgi:hypothetical protein